MSMYTLCTAHMTTVVQALVVHVVKGTSFAPTSFALSSVVRKTGEGLPLRFQAYLPHALALPGVCCKINYICPLVSHGMAELMHCLTAPTCPIVPSMQVRALPGGV